jgi:copper amine oxidase domain protein
MAYGLTQEEAKLYYLINEYRTSLGLERFSFSKSLTEVARNHVADSNANQPENQLDARGIKGNLHSWSSSGNWTPVAYTSDHAYAELMWMKPRELTAYTGNGYEISAASSGGISAETALELWKGSSGHNAVIIGSGSWSMLKTMGVSIDGNYAHVWFGSDADPAGYYDIAGYAVTYP